MKSILVPVENNPRLSAVLATATRIARRFDSHICAFGLKPAATPFIAADVIGASVMYEPVAEYDEQELEAARKDFETAMASAGIERASAREGRPTWSWRNDLPPGDHVLGVLGRVFDLTVVGRPEAKASGPRSSTLDAALFDSGRPILIAPPTPPETIGERVLIAWNRSTETARTVALAMPILTQAAEVVVLTINGWNVAGPTGEELLVYLREHGIKARHMPVDPGKRTPGEAILNEARHLGADLLIKGAFTQSRLRQIIFGGATRHIIAEAELPVFMAH